MVHEHRGRGYGKIALQAITKQVAKLNHDVFGCVYDQNNVSQSLFEKLGFTVVDVVYCLRTNPTVPS